MPSYEEKCNLVKMSINEKWYLVKLTQAWPDGHLINQLAKALIESNSELLSLRERVAILELEPTYSGMTAQERVAHGRGVAEQLEALKQQKPIGQVISCNGNKTLGWINDVPVGTLLFTAAKPAGG